MKGKVMGMLEIWDERVMERELVSEVSRVYGDEEKDWPSKYPLTIGAPFAEPSLLP